MPATPGRAVGRGPGRPARGWFAAMMIGLPVFGQANVARGETEVGDTDSIQRLTDLQGWWLHLPDTPLYTYWRAALIGLALIAAVVIVWALVLLALDQGESRAYRRRMRRGEQPPTPVKPNPWGILARWCVVLRQLRDKHHAADPDTLELMLEGRYGWSETWLSGLKAIATLTGLFFTFLGLAFTLEDLSTALQLPAEGTAAQVKEAVDNVRRALPGLGTAFASSIFGVGLAIAIGLVDAGLRTWRVRLGSRMGVLSAEWLQPHYVLPRGEGAVLRLLEGQEETFRRGLEGFGDRMAELHDRADERNAGLLAAIQQTHERTAGLAADSKKVITILAGVATRLEALPAATEEAWGRILADQKTQHDTVMTGINSATEEAASQLQTALTNARTAVEEDLAAMRDAVTEGTTALSGAITDIGEAGEGVLTRLTEVSDSLTNNAEAFGEVASNAATALDVSSTQVRDLRQASEQFRSALVRVEAITEAGAATKARELREMNRAFGTIGEMAEAVTESAATSAEAAQRLQKVLGGQDMVRYLNQLPHLAELAEREREAREAMHEAVSTFTRVATAVQTLDQHTDRIGQTAALMRVAHERLMASHAQLTESMASLVQGNVVPVVESVVRTTVAELTQRTEAAWQKRYTAILKQHEQRLAELAAVTGRLERTERELIGWLQSSTWARLFGRS